MHIPDGFLDIATAAITYLLSLGYGGYALSKVKRTFNPDTVSLVTVLAAAIFAAQMLNWPLPGGTSLHFVGGALAAILLGPWLGFLTMFLVVFIQCVVFHDGGITALGANVLNMAIIDCLVGYLIYRSAVKLFGRRDSVRSIAAFLGGWFGITIAGLACGLEIGYSPAFPYGVTVTVPIMTGWHAVLGVIEGVITSVVVLYVARRSPHLIMSEAG
ncbi:MAG: metal transporter [Thermoprotei archaeon]|nr:MAG: metal transporter [Thermoprotei archaeon]